MKDIVQLKNINIFLDFTLPLTSQKTIRIYESFRTNPED